MEEESGRGIWGRKLGEEHREERGTSERQEKPWVRNTGGETMEKESWRRRLGGEIIEGSCKRNHAGEIEQSWTSHHGVAIKHEQS